MKADYAGWSLYDIEKEVKKSSYIPFLQYVFQNNGIDKIFEILKTSGYFISFNERSVIKAEQKKKVEEFVKSNFDLKSKKKYDNLKNESNILLEKQSEIINYVDDLLKKYKIPYISLINFVVERFNESINEIENNDYHKISTKEYWVYALGVLLKTMMHNGNSIIEETLVIPDEELQNLFYYTFLYRELNEVIQSWMFGEVMVISEWDSLTIEELLGRNIDRVISSINYWDIKDAKDLKSQIIELEKGNFEDNLNIYIISLESKVKEYFYTVDYQEKYLDIPLSNWIKVYTFFAKKAYESKESIISFESNQLKEELIDAGLHNNEPEIVLKILTFKKNSNDLFDSFLIAMGETLLFVPSIFLFTDPSRAMISLFGKIDNDSVGINQKGTGFENHIYSLVKENHKINIISNVKVNYKDEMYELDLAFVLDNNLFICECKTQYQHENMRGYYRNLRELDYYLEKFRRNYNFFIEGEGKQIIQKRLGIFSYENFYPIFISNIVFVERKIGNIYITDEPRIYRYMKRIPAHIAILKPGEKVFNQIRLFPQFYEGDITAAQFIEYLDNKDKELDIDKKRVVLSENPTLNSLGISSKRYIDNKNILLDIKTVNTCP